MSVVERSSPMSIARARVAPTPARFVVARLRDLALLPALALLVLIGAIVSPVFLTSGNINTTPVVPGVEKAPPSTEPTTTPPASR